MRQAGACRFGLSAGSVVKILNSAKQPPGECRKLHRLDPWIGGLSAKADRLKFNRSIKTTSVSVQPWRRTLCEQLLW